MWFIAIFAICSLALESFALKPVAPSSLLTPPTWCDQTNYAAEDGNRVLDTRDGSIECVYDLNEGPFAGTPDQAAQAFLAAHTDWLTSAPGSELRVVRSVESLVGHHITFHRFVGDLPVYPGDVVVTLDHQNRVIFYVSSVHALPANIATGVTLSAEQAVAAAHRHLQPASKPRDEAQTELVIWAGDNKDFTPCWRVWQFMEKPAGDWEVLVDANSGAIRRVRDRACFVNGSGWIFRPDPLTTAQVNYGGNYADASDASNAQLLAQEFVDSLYNITLNGSTYRLQGPFCTIADFESPTSAPVTATHPDSFRFNRLAQGFEDVMAYHYISTSQAHIQSLGVMNVQNTSINVDPHGLSGDDNSHYIPSTNRIAFGEGGVDDAEDADVILHEYGHAIQTGTVPNWGAAGDERAMGEGFGDYWAACYSHSVSTFHDTWVYNWDGHNPYWDGRAVNLNLHYPENNTDIYTGGEIWSQACYETMLDIGRDAMDQIVLQHHFLLGTSATMLTAARAILAVDDALNGGVHRNFIFARFQPRGFLPAPATFGLLAPNGGDFWPVDSTVTVSWNPGGLTGRVRVQISRNGEPWTLLADSVVNLGRVDVVAVGPQTANARVRIQYLGSPARADSSDSAFVIQDFHALYCTGFDNGADDWTHAISGGTWVDQWHLSPARVHSDTASYHCGDANSGNYANRLDACLYTPVLQSLPPNSMISFWHYMDAEAVSPFGADSVNDGGMLEISVNGGAYTQLFPEVGGYNSMIRRNSNPTGPFARGARVWSSLSDWNKVTCRLGAYAGQNVQLRFRFGSNSSTGREGWYVDDVCIYGAASMPAVQRVTCYWNTNGTVTLRWPSAGETVQYKVYRSDSVSGPYDFLVGVTDQTSMTITAPLSETPKFYIVKSWDGND